MISIDLLMLGSAWLIGVFASAHCALMCGGVAVSLSAQLDGSRLAALQLQLGRILGYSLAGALAGGAVQSVIVLLNLPKLGLYLRALAGVVLVLLAARIAGWPHFDRLFGAPFKSLDNGLWRRMAPLRDWVWPKTHAPKAWQRLAMGALWGWMPCGLSLTLLKAALLRANALEGALLMAAFGIGTLPMMYGLSRTGSAARLAAPRVAGALIASAGVLTLAMPWLMHRPELHGLLSRLGWCVG